MPWLEVKPMEQKVQLIADWNSSNFSKTDLSKKYNIVRKTVHKWIKRYQEQGIDGLKELSREPHSKPNTTPIHLLNRIIQYKLEHRKRGPKKIYAYLTKTHPNTNWPLPSTIGYWLKKNNLVNTRKKIHRVPAYNDYFLKCLAPNDVWSVDYKGQFYTKDKHICYPLTISDNFSRYLFACKGLSGTKYKETKNVFENVFREYGIPKAIRSDKGTPFASKSVAGLTRLSIWWIQLGVIPERIKKGCPQQNGRHERMHRTLKYEALDPIARNMKAQQKQFNYFKTDFNEHRPHEALGQKTPSEYYKKSPRIYNGRIHKPNYDYDFIVRQVRNNGEIRFKGKLYYLSTMLDDQPVGLKQVDEDTLDIYYYFYPIASLNLRKNKVFSK